MGEDKQTFTDPETGQEIESTWLARYVGGLLFGIIRGMFFGVLLGMVIFMAGAYSLRRDLGGDVTIFRILLMIKRSFGLSAGVGLLAGIVGGVLGGISYARGTSRAGDKLHDNIARTQHRRRILHSQDDQDVPDTAISRAQPPGNPQPTDAALSIADDPEETHLSVGVTEDAEAAVDDRS